MLEGKVRQVMKLVDAESDVAWLHDVNERVREILRSKHPAAEDIQLRCPLQQRIANKCPRSGIWEWFKGIGGGPAKKNRFCSFWDML